MLSRLFGKWLRKFDFANVSYSLEGEDLILSEIFGDKRSGFYIDVGAHHPKRFSNTYMFYKRGWRGINIDPLISQSSLFNRARPRDINVGIGISEKGGHIEYFEFNEPALNTFSRERRDFLLENHGQTYKLNRTCIVQTKPLFEVLNEHFPPNQSIDFLSVDVEGFDDVVLATNDWSKYRPTIVLVEELSQQNDKPKIEALLKPQGYELVARTIRTLIFRRKES